MAPSKPVDPYVSVIVPSFNESPEIIRESLSSLSAQTFSDFECIVVDESTDPVCAAACKDICELDGRFTYVHPENRLGLAGSLNMGIELSRGKWIARFDSDDICLSDRLSKQVEFLNNSPDVDILGGAMEIMDDEGRTLGFRDYPLTHHGISLKFMFSNSIAHPTVIFRREVVSKFGLYNTNYRYSEDLELWLRLLRQGARFSNLKDVLVRYRQQNTNRPVGNWKFNARARLCNTGFLRLVLSWPLILAIYVWGSFPVGLQESVYKYLIFRKS